MGEIKTIYSENGRKSSNQNIISYHCIWLELTHDFFLLRFLNVLPIFVFLINYFFFFFRTFLFVFGGAGTLLNMTKNTFFEFFLVNLTIFFLFLIATTLGSVAGLIWRWQGLPCFLDINSFIKDRLRQLNKGSINVDIGFGRCFQKSNSVFTGNSLAWNTIYFLLNKRNFMGVF